MVKKKSPIKFIIPIAIVGIFGVAYLTTGFPIQYLPVNAETESITQQELLDDLSNVSPALFGFPIPIVGEFGTEPTTTIGQIFNECDTTPIPNTELLLEECNNEVIDPIQNMTVIVDDDATTMPEMLPPEPELFEVSISSTVFKTDNNGTIFESTTNFDIPLLAFFVEDSSNLDFDNGFIQQELVLKAIPNTQITLNGDFDILISNQTVLPEPLTIAITGVTDENGELQIDYVNSFGLKTREFTFSFADHVDKFPITGTEKIEFVLSNVRVTSGTFEYELGSVAIYTVDVATDANQLIITDEQGGRTRVFPTDDTLRIYTSRSTFTITPNCNPRRICSKPYTACCYNAPAMGGGKVTHILQDGSEMVLVNFNSNSQSSSSITKVNIQIQRNEIYRIDFDSPTKASITFKTPMERDSYSFYCKGTSATGTTGLGYCNFLQASVQQALADTLNS